MQNKFSIYSGKRKNVFFFLGVEQLLQMVSSK